MQTIAVTGLMGSGKSEVLKLLEKQNFAVAQADGIVRSVVLKILQEEEQKDPNLKADLLTGWMEVKDLKELQQYSRPGKHKKHSKRGDSTNGDGKEALFRAARKLQRIEKLLHPLVQESFEGFAAEKEAAGEPFIFYEIPPLLSLVEPEEESAAEGESASAGKSAAEEERAPAGKKQTDPLKNDETRQKILASVKELFRERERRKRKQRGEKAALFGERFDSVILIVRPQEAARQSLLQKGFQESDIQARLENQAPEDFLEERADFILRNTGDLKSLSKGLNVILKRLAATNNH